MRFKTDENLHEEVAALLRQRGHDACTVWDEDLRGHGDPEIASVCRDEGRALITLDLDFADLRTYPPAEYMGLIVIRADSQSRRRILEIVNRVLPLFASELVAGKLWIVDREGKRVRIRDG